MRRFLVVLVLLSLSFQSCSDSTPAEKAPLPIGGLTNAELEAAAHEKKEDAFEGIRSARLLLRGAKVMTAAGATHDPGYVLIENGRILDVGAGSGPTGDPAQVLELAGRTITPGVIDSHSHMGVYPQPGVSANSDGNEMVNPMTPEVSAQDAFWPQDPALWRAIAGGITTIQVLPGSGNMIGGKSFTAKLIPNNAASKMRFRGTPVGIKMACGENPKRVYGEEGGPMTRMGSGARFRQAFQRAVEYGQTWKSYEEKLAIWNRGSRTEPKPMAPARDFGLETLSRMLKGEILAHVHCYRADDISVILDIAGEFGFTVRSFHHALEAYKVRERMVRAGSSISTWADWWGFKMEALDGIPQNAAFFEASGGRAIIHSDSEHDVRFLNQEAAKAMAAGRKIGIAITEDQALRWITANPAWALGADHLVGTLEKGKMADLVVWDASPFSVYARAEAVYINGSVIFDRARGVYPSSDFEAGIRSASPVNPKPGLDLAALSSQPTAVGSAPYLRTGAQAVSGSFLIQGARVALGEGKLLEKADVLVVDGKIAQVASDIVAPAGTVTIQAKGKFVTPGLIQPDTHIGLYEADLETSANDTASVGIVPGLRTVDAFNPASSRIPVTREEGITSAITRFKGDVVYGTSHFFDLDGSASSPVEKGYPTVFGGIGSTAARAVGGSRTRAELWMQLRNFFKEAQSAEKPNTHQAALRPFLKGEAPFVFEANRASDILALVRFKHELSKLAPGASAAPKMVVLGGREAWLVAGELAREQIPVILTPSAQSPGSFDHLAVRDDAATVLDAAGVKLILNATSEDSGARRIRQEAGVAVAYGLPYEKALQAITKNPAEVFGRGQEIGSLEAGKLANLVIWSGDPLEASSIAERIWIEGKEQGYVNRQVELALKYR